MKLIPLSSKSKRKYYNQYFAQVDDSDYDELIKHSWSVLKTKCGILYAVKKTGIGNGTVRLHRFIMKVTDPKMEIDHKDGDGLNCQRNNMRIATHEQNNYNRKTKGKSKYNGVSWCKERGSWEACIKANGIRHRLGRFKDEETAARVRDKKAIQLHGEFAKLNFPLNSHQTIVAYE